MQAFDAGGANPGSPFHDGERRVQQRIGSAERAEAAGRRMIRDHLIEQHREFFAGLHMLLAGSTDDAGRPWAAVLAGPPGFAHSPDPSRLRVDAHPVGGAPHAALGPGARLGLLGIDFSTRRRNRVNGRVESVDERGFTLRVDHAFGNCPKYIQLRETQLPAGRHWRVQPVAPRRLQAGDAKLRRLIETADQLYIASHHPGDARDPRNGVDVSHRGGLPGFATVNEHGDVVFPDFAGNRFFNTLGNLEADERAGLAFLDFDDGSLYALSGRARIDWRGERETGLRGAERLVRVRIEEAWVHERVLPFRWRLLERSPLLAGTGTWAEAGRGA